MEEGADAAQAAGGESPGFLSGVLASPVWMIVGVLAVAAGIGWYMFKTYRHSESNDLLEAIGTETYEFEFPPEVEAYDLVKRANPDDAECLKKALFKRAVAVVPIIHFMHNENAKYEQMAKASGLNQANFDSFQASFQVCVMCDVWGLVRRH